MTVIVLQVQMSEGSVRLAIFPLTTFAVLSLQKKKKKDKKKAVCQGFSFALLVIYASKRLWHYLPDSVIFLCVLFW